MLRNDEVIALNVLMFAERWKLEPWLDIQWNEDKGTYSTLILDSPQDSDEEEAEYEIESLDDLNILLETGHEFYRNVTTLISIGALETHDVQIESLVRVIIDRITGTSSKKAYPYSMVTGKFSPTESHVYQFDEKESATGRLALEVIRVFSRTGDWWGETLTIKHENKVWSDRDGMYVTSENKYFTVNVSVDDVYRMACHRTVRVTEDNFDLLVATVNDLMIDVSVELSLEYGVSRSFWASVLFCELSGEIDDDIANFALRKLPPEVVALLPYDIAATL